MLVLSRKPGEKVVLGNITVTLLGVHGNRVRVGFEAPEAVTILRGELACWQEGESADRESEAPTQSANPLRSNGSARAKN